MKKGIDEYQKLGFWHNSSVVEGDYLYWICLFDGTFMKVDIIDRKAEYLIPTNVDKLPHMYYGNVLFVRNNVLYGFFQSGKYFYKYDLRNNICDIKEINHDDELLYICSQKKMVEDGVIIVPAFSSNIFKINYCNLKLDSISIEHGEEQKNTYIWRNARTISDRNDDRIECFLRDGKTLLSLDCNSMTYTSINYPQEFGIISMARKINGIWYILNNKNQLYEWNGEKTRRICELNKKDEYQIFTVKGNKAYFFPPSSENDIIIFDFLSLEFWKFNEYSMTFKYNNPEREYWNKYGTTCHDNRFQYVAMQCGNDILRVDDCGMECMNVQWPKVEETIETFWKYNRIVYENDSFDFKDYLEFIL